MQTFTFNQLDQLACNIAKTVVNGNFKDGLATISVLNPLQTMWVFNELREYLPDSYFYTLLQMAGAKMNDSQYFEGLKELGESLSRPE